MVIRGSLCMEKIRNEVRVKFSKEEVSNNDDQGNGLIVLPYVKGTAEQLKRILYNNFKVAMRPTLTLRNMLMKPKDCIPTLKKSGVVYRIHCKDCDVQYIGETGRALGTTRNDYERAVLRLRRTEKSALAHHVMKFDHLIAWNEPNVYVL